MNYTNNYHLPQWVESDRILMEDFNDAMAGIDLGIQGARTAADNAQAAATAAQNTASAVADAYTPDNKPYVVGYYSGSGIGAQQIDLGFRPSMVIVSGEKRTTDQTDVMLYTAIAAANGPGLTISLTDTGFEVSTVGDYLPYLNACGYSYRYIAFR